MRRASLLLLSTVMTIAVSCGARSQLEDPAVSSAAPGGSATGGSGGAAIDAGPDAAPPPPPVPCELTTGVAWTILSFPDRNATAASAVALGASEIAVQVFANDGWNPHPDEIQIASFSMGKSWPVDITMVKEPKLFGAESHGWANLALSGNGAQLALGWHGKLGIGKPMFRLWDVASWSPQVPIELAQTGDTVIATAAGAGVGGLGIGYGGQGWGVIWNESAPAGAPSTPLAAVLDATGQIVIGPHAAAGVAEYPGRVPSMSWSGATYLMATSCTTSSPTDALCDPFSVVITRIRPSSGDLVDDSGIDFVTSLPAQPGSVFVGRAAIARHGERTYVAWSEGDSIEQAEPRRVFVAELSPMGDVVSPPVLVEDGARILSPVSLLASELGVSVTWAEKGDPETPSNQIGFSAIVTTHLSLDLEELAHRITVPTTYWDPYGPPTAIALREPRSLLLMWSGNRENGPGTGERDVWAARLDCFEP